VLKDRIKRNLGRERAEKSPLLNVRREIAEEVGRHIEQFGAEIMAALVRNLDIPTDIKRLLSKEIRDELSPKKGKDYVDGRDGKTGMPGINGKDGINGAVPKIIDANIDISSSLASYEISGGLNPLDIVWVYLNKGNSYAALPFKGYASSVDQDFLKLDCYADIWKFRVYIDNATVVPAGATYNFRIVIVRGTKSGKIKQPSYEELQKMYNLPN